MSMSRHCEVDWKLNAKTVVKLRRVTSECRLVGHPLYLSYLKVLGASVVVFLDVYYLSSISL